ncbi:hypothetical protein FNF28_06000 [Cafeteria roenbergensis]|uniref:Histidine kinase/HSP90-like ATPase domain-containing protein n=1 Tax=Cafeteria roenbergensis TaxID=33653 RepID=A0A5A8D0W4_CAFRO|nr:hypothetical protein FNF28_06000 [Cafeteria roenbergensis]
MAAAASAAPKRHFAADASGTAAAASSATKEPLASETGPAENHVFQTETRQLLDIVAHALYTDRHIFVRELISNSSDALEKLRHMQTTGEPVEDPDRPLEISISTDEEAGTVTISDSGVGMSREELMENIGTIAHSGSKAFVKQAREAGSKDVGANLIGQFGVGFYSAFMVAEEITVYSKSARPDAPGHVWRSKGEGEYSLARADGLKRGTTIVLKLRSNAKDFSRTKTVEDVVKRHSNFVGFPILVGGEQVNTVGAIWAEPKHLVTEEQYLGFFRFKTGQQYSSPLMRLHFAADAPLELRALFFVPELNEEGFGLGRAKPGVDLYSRKVLIEAESGVMPEWLRFLKGVVDSEDIPLNISRESMQDTALMLRIKSVLTRRVLRFLESELRRDRALYSKFFAEFGTYLKEGVCSDAPYQPDIARLMLFESSALPAGELTTLDEYISRCPPGQERLYYIVAPHRGLAEASPYMEAFKGAGAGGRDVEVLYAYSSIDDFVFQQLGQYNGRSVVTAEASDLGLSPPKPADKKADGSMADGDSSKDSAASSSSPALSPEQVAELGEWLSSEALSGRVKVVRASDRLRSTPAVVVDHESASVRRMMKMLDAHKRDSESPSAAEQVLPRQTLEINPSHPVIVALHKQRASQPSVAKAVAEQVFDNALVAAGLLDDARSMLPRLNALLSTVMNAMDGVAEPADIGEDHAGTSKRHVPMGEAAFRDSKMALEDVMQDELLKDPATLQADVDRFAREQAQGQGEAQGATANEEVEPEVMRVGPDGRLIGGSYDPDQDGDRR